MFKTAIYLWETDEFTVSASDLYGCYEVWIMFIYHLYCFLYTMEPVQLLEIFLMFAADLCGIEKGIFFLSVSAKELMQS